MELYLPWKILGGNGGWRIKDARGKCVALGIPSKEMAEVIISWVALGAKVSSLDSEERDADVQ